MIASRKVIVIGSGFAGLAAASFMAKQGWKVTVLEKHSGPGGRARQLQSSGFSFDRGPSFYWMPDVFERYFASFGKKRADYYSILRLDPSYRIYWTDGFTDLPASIEGLKSLFESLEPGSAAKLDKYLEGAAYKYKVGINHLVYKPGRSVTEYMDWETIKGVFKLDVFTSIKKHIHKYFRHPKLRQIMEFPVLFLGALPKDTPALYSLMNYADMEGGTWYPPGGIFTVVDAMYKLATELGVEFRFNENVQSIRVENGLAREVVTEKGEYRPEVVISGADYHFTETCLLSPEYRSYSTSYWDKRTMAPSCLLYYVGLNKKLSNALHHSLFFDVPFDRHGNEIYETPRWPSDPLFYVSAPTVSDASIAPNGSEGLVLLVPVAAGLSGDDDDLRDRYFDRILSRMERHLGQNISSSITYRQSYAGTDFVNDYNSFRGNAYGLANTLRQTAILRPSCQSRKVKNLFFTGQLTVPGPGVPPSLISGEVVAKQVSKVFG
jgi:phytoene desaturase